MNYENISDGKMSTIVNDMLQDLTDRDTIRNQFYSGRDWQRTRSIVKARDHNIDVWEFIKSGQIVQYTGDKELVVHHIEPLFENWEARMDFNNLVTLSVRSHIEVERLYNLSAKTKTKTQALLTKAVHELHYLIGEDEVA